ncbi:PREDICTED: cell division cycle-associated protein 7-like [Dufourea novaeangliae]|uniref:Cell division cycle-associated 7-like protein n=1 Tax=Dufourea novaeangliae TaxID=178035 RepID=A0A154PHA3_DUFNO|nr:PREDICTED: cell division cycle-associated protein 7-like [Dufourea novaeangliae]KZC10560.1 Cell division cycle-associated 7-like protein [Dufourea novaeangliae]
MDNNDDYDSLRKQNIAERNAVFAEFFKDIKTQTTEIKKLKSKEDTENIENEQPRKRRRTNSGAVDDGNIKFNRVNLEFRKKYNTRSRTKNGIKGDSDEPKSNKRKLHVLFPWAKPFQRSIDLMKMGVCDVDEEEYENNQDRDHDDDDDDYDYDNDDDDNNDSYNHVTNRRVFKISKSAYNPETIPSVDEITEAMLNNIARKSSTKDYCKIKGTSCHQCRQKTLDTKTVCRSGECIGIRGQFCGPCLKGRYGESAVEALKDPNWACPPCRGLCNCSICRTRSGLRPTGILAPVAQEEGYSSVKDYLQSIEIDDT